MQTLCLDQSSADPDHRKIAKFFSDQSLVSSTRKQHSYMYGVHLRIQTLIFSFFRFYFYKGKSSMGMFSFGSVPNSNDEDYL
jgi:hypothetical protein